MRSCCGFKVTMISTYYANVYMCSEQFGAKLWPAWRARTGLDNEACVRVRTVVTVSHGRGSRIGMRITLSHRKRSEEDVVVQFGRESALCCYCRFYSPRILPQLRHKSLWFPYEIECLWRLKWCLREFGHTVWVKPRFTFSGTIFFF